MKQHFIRRFPALCLIAVIVGLTFITATPAQAADGWKHWWLPDDYSKHGYAIDALFVWIFWITMVAFVGVEIVLVIFLIKYRHNPNRRAVFTHGNTRLEMCWTLAPAIILAGIALFSKKVWDNYRYSDMSNDPNLAKILVIGEQFKWNVIYPGADGKFGKYLVWPKPTDMAWPKQANGQPTTFAGVAGPAYLPEAEARSAIKKYIGQENPLGKVFDDPAGQDDDWSKTPGREINIPYNRPVEVQLGSKDVIHDFFLPNFRVKLDAVPGMRGKLHFIATKTSAQREAENLKTYKIDELAAVMDKPGAADFTVRIDESIKSDAANKDRTGWRYIDPKDTKKATIIRNAAGIPADPDRRKTMFEKLRTAGVTELTVYNPGYFELVCEELCGQGHYTMKGQVFVLDNDKYIERFETKKTAQAPFVAPQLAEAAK